VTADARQPDDRTSRDRRANAADRWGNDPYAARRATAARRRAKQERTGYDPRPPTDDDWTLADDEERLRILRRPDSVGELLDRFVQDKRWQTRVQGATVFSRWTEIVGPDVARRCEPVRLANGNLLIRAENQTWATQLNYMLAHIAEKACVVVGAGMVRRVTVVVGTLKGTTTAPPDD
jgi:predicted nucleic acid-binding Zn ribbon protein